MVIVVTFVVFLVILFAGVVVVTFLVRLIALLLKIGLGLLVGGGLGILVSICTSALGADGSELGIAIGLLGTAAMILFLSRSHLEPGRKMAPVIARSGLPSLPAEKVLLRQPLIVPRLADRFERAVQATQHAAATYPLDMSVVECSSVLNRVPDLIAETVALYETACADEQAILRGQLADDLGRLVEETGRRLVAIQRDRRNVLRRWVAIRTGHDYH